MPPIGIRIGSAEVGAFGFSGGAAGFGAFLSGMGIGMPGISCAIAGTATTASTIALAAANETSFTTNLREKRRRSKRRLPLLSYLAAWPA